MRDSLFLLVISSSASGEPNLLPQNQAFHPSTTCCFREQRTASKAEKEPKKEKKVKPSREERGYTEPRGPKKKDDWKQFFAPENSKWLKGEKPDFEEEGWARRKPKKK